MIKRISVSLVLLLASMFTYAQSLGWTLTVSPAAPCAGVPVSFSVIDPSGSATTITGYFDFGDGSTGWGNFVSHTYATPGTYNITWAAWDSLTMTSDSAAFTLFVDSICGPVDVISGKVYNDLNGNGTQDAGESERPYTLVEIVAGSIYTTSDIAGDYAIAVGPGSYTVEVVPPLYRTVSEPVAGSYSITTTGAGATFGGNDFGLAPIPGINDLRVEVYTVPHVPGFSRHINIHAYNAGTSTLSGNIDVTLDPNVTFTSASGGGTYSSPVVSIPFTGKDPGEYWWEDIEVSVPLSVPLGATISYSAVINPVAGDAAPADNYDTTSVITVASYDPNDKAVSPSGAIVPGTLLDYKIRFQNTGTWYATNVIVRDTLDDANLDLATFSMTGGSHTYSWHLDGNVLTVEFIGINLPWESFDEPASHGQFTFKIRAKSGLADGTDINNRAAIYFDFNAPIITNTVTSTIDLSTAVRDADGMIHTEVFPNPFSEMVTVRFSNPSGVRHSFILMDVNGRVLRTMDNISGESFTLRRENLAAGMYLFRLQGEDGTSLAGRMTVN